MFLYITYHINIFGINNMTHKLKGRDGRMVAIPRGKHGIENSRGRIEPKG